MNAVQIPFAVEGALILIAGVLGLFLGRRGRPYGRAKLVFHLFFFVWFATGYGFIVPSLVGQGVGLAVWIFVGVMGAALASQLVTGLGILVWKWKVRPRVHLVSAAVLLLSDLTVVIAAGV